MIFRLSQKLSTHIKVSTRAALPMDANPLADWSAHIFSVARIRYMILSNTRSLYSTVMYAKGINDGNEFIICALKSICEFMEDDGQQFAYQRFVAPARSSVCFGKAFSRSVIGSMNDLIYHASIRLHEGNLSPHEVGLKLNDIPFSSLAAGEAKSYATPREAFKALLL